MSDGLPDPISPPPARLRWEASDGPATLRRELTERGIAVLAAGTALDFAEAQRAPWSFVERLFGERPAMVERQTIRSLPQGRHFATGTMPAPFHTDSQCFLGAPPHVQLMLCIRPAARGGENRFLDSWTLLERLEREEPEFLSQLLTRHRRIPFVFGDFFGPTLAWRGGSLVFTQAARATPGDALEERLAAWLERIAPIELSLEAGELVAIHNHRMLHGRRGFEDEEREFLRLLVWLRRPFASPHGLAARAAEISERAAHRLADFPAGVRRRFGLESVDPESTAQHRLDLVLEMLRGVPPGLLARRERIAEPELYRWRDAALAAALDSLAPDPTSESEGDEETQDLERALSLLK